MKHILNVSLSSNCRSLQGGVVISHCLSWERVFWISTFLFEDYMSFLHVPSVLIFMFYPSMYLCITYVMCKFFNIPQAAFQSFAINFVNRNKLMLLNKWKREGFTSYPNIMWKVHNLKHQRSWKVLNYLSQPSLKRNFTLVANGST